MANKDVNSFLKVSGQVSIYLIPFIRVHYKSNA